MEKFAEDDRLNPSHVSLYLALFQMWNLSHFENPISIARNEMKKLSKIGSNNTYLKCLNDLTNYGYIQYLPSYNPYKGSTVNLYSFDTGNVQVKRHNHVGNDTGSKQVLRPSLNIVKHNKHKERETEFTPPELEDLISFFKKLIEENKHQLNPSKEAQKFYNHYKSNGWRIGKNEMRDWQASAENWIIKSLEFNNSNSLNTNRLHTNQNKNYDQPL